MYHYNIINAIPNNIDEDFITITTSFILGEDDKEKFRNTMLDFKKKFPKQQFFDIVWRACNCHGFHIKPYNETLNMQGIIVF